MDAARRRTWIIVEVVAIVIAVAVGAFFGVRARDGDDGEQAAAAVPTVPTNPMNLAAPSSSPPATTTTVPPPDTTPPATGDVMAPATTAPGTTAPSAPPATAATPTTTTMRPPLVAPTDDLLAATIPQPDDLPDDWFSRPDSTPFPGLLPPLASAGYCGGPALDERAPDAGAVAAAWWNASPPTLALWRVAVIGFASDVDADAFLETTRAQIAGCGGVFSLQLPEGDGSAGTFDGFFDEDPAVDWTIDDVATPTDADIDSADDALRVMRTLKYSTLRDGTAWGFTDSHARQYERYGPIVVVHHLASTGDFVGYDYPNASTYVVSSRDVRETADEFRDLIVSRLVSQSLIHPV